MNVYQVADEIARKAGKSLVDITMVSNVYRRVSTAFDAYFTVECMVKKLGYAHSPMCEDLPIGLTKKLDHLCKWNKLDISDYHYLDGVILADNFRDAKEIYIAFFD